MAGRSDNVAAAANVNMRGIVLDDDRRCCGFCRRGNCRRNCRRLVVIFTVTPQVSPVHYYLLLLGMTERYEG